ncbi:MAG: recombination protein RecR [Legionellales bacterium]|nr:recombination protein RecR [Legionellales bacterium]
MKVGFSPLIQQLVEALRCLPGVGPKSAQRMALMLLEKNRDGGLHLATCLEQAMAQVDRCLNCRILCEGSVCAICQQTSRDNGTICIVSSAADVLALEQTAVFKGQYFVLSGVLSPIDGIGPEDIGLPQLKERLMRDNVQELILAVSPTVEGEATAFYISEMAKPFGVKVTRIAQGVPRGSELEYIDSSTLAGALSSRDEF